MWGTLPQLGNADEQTSKKMSITSMPYLWRINTIRRVGSECNRGTCNDKGGKLNNHLQDCSFLDCETALWLEDLWGVGLQM